MLMMDMLVRDGGGGTAVFYWIIEFADMFETQFSRTHIIG